jgi:hypothetical protein
METEARNSIFIGGRRLRLEYDFDGGGDAGGEGGQPRGERAAMDWVCDMCKGGRGGAGGRNALCSPFS